MDSVTRKLYHVCRGNRALPDALLPRNGWKIDRIDIGARTRNRGRLAGGAGGLIDIASMKFPRDMEALSDILAARDVGWVAALWPGQLEDVSIRSIVRGRCMGYITLPTTPDELGHAVGHARGMALLTEPVIHDPRTIVDGEMIGSCETMLHLFRMIRKVAICNAPVLIQGESGTGKELTALSIHRHSARRYAPFVAINCGAMPEHLVMSELFGYERGAFTGASERKAGRIEAANGGTVFLDEIADLPMKSQAGLLRFLQEQRIERLGCAQSIPVDVRIVCATHVDLKQATSERRFREDLYHRLNVLQIDEPPLRARGADIELLARHLLDKLREDSGRRIRGFSDDAVRALRAHDWPGNVRELRNRVWRAVVMFDSSTITASDLGLSHCIDARTSSLDQVRRDAERRAIERALLRHRGKVADAARELDISRVTLYRLLESYEVDIARFLRGMRTDVPLTVADAYQSRIQRRGSCDSAGDQRGVTGIFQGSCTS
ncbi:DNA-binding transcriptional response regulator, NtrC family, contains REC, AAA-type ATPase, and a Fis-type DNA-binding domains [Paraburkholderia steynii]|uniref:DNA-binding transcriptional response regulator, NtrC family, contains REC, AAA-type ATPase, and a Fis-type DNA-binding domains n=1 Tax=Paraburkholderia steynii TaxID=1245441 RepID=A0A7Z7BMK3_9BURK|nr:sigma-54 dependent transcriptional regulator [Paraburkholderia steynii]SDJ59931.1 DNA-binding transcriptional response regulator, NtrC family, contains REC, AAA-type ATPase, and a Fis-type DNA-binding domains [Paraburkholderia steynii]